MKLAKWHASEEFGHFADEMDRWFEEVFGGRRPGLMHWRERRVRPWADVYETDEEVVVKMEVPGVKKEDLEITLGEREVTVSGETQKDEEVSEAGYHRRERRWGSFMRTVPLPARVAVAEAKASFKDGVLELRARKHPEEKAAKRKVEIP